MNSFFFLFVGLVVGCIIGWRASRRFYRVPQMLELIELMGEILQGNLSQEEAKERLKNIKL